MIEKNERVVNIEYKLDWSLIDPVTFVLKVKKSLTFRLDFLLSTLNSASS